MIDFLGQVRLFLQGEVLFAFGLYSVIFFLGRKVFLQNESLIEFDQTAVGLARWCGSAYGLLWLSMVLWSTLISDSLDIERWMSLKVVPTIIAWFLQPVFWIFFPQLLKFEKLQQNVVFRLLFGLMAYLSIDRVVVIATSLHRDYVPVFSKLDWLELGLNFSLMTGVFIFITGIVSFLKHRIRC